jgi:phosphate transport system substrate-binding protein
MHGLITHERKACMINSNRARLTLSVVFVLTSCLLALITARTLAAAVQLTVAGSTLLYPLFKLWVPDYVASNPSVTFTTHATGSGAGIDAAISGTAQIGASDAYMSDEQAEQNPQIVNIPLAISAQTVNYNVPDVRGITLKLDGPTLAGIYSGVIREWDSEPIKALNASVMLPHHVIIPIRRAEGSGDTFIFTQFLNFSTPSWADQIGYGITIVWPSVPGEMTAIGNEGMVQTTAGTPYSIAYIGISFAGEIAKAGLGTAKIGNQNRQFLLPSADTVSAAASELDHRTPADERLSLVFAPGDDSYPLINYEYAVVSTRQANKEVAEAVRGFLLWANSPLGGNTSKYLDAVHFIPLPDFIRALNEKQIRRIQ